MNPTTAVSLWLGLLDGSCRIVGRVERAEGCSLVLRRAPAPTSQPLVTREREIVTLAAEGGAIKEIAFDLGLTSHTVNQVLNGALKKMGIKSRAELVRPARCAASAGRGSRIEEFRA